jgi:hypothetical protein
MARTHPKEKGQKKEEWDVTIASTICEYCGQNTKQCNFIYDDNAPILEGKNRLEIKCLNTKCQKKDTCFLPDLRCKNNGCTGENKILEFNFLLDKDQQLFVGSICRACNNRRLSPFVCIYLDCYFPLILIDYNQNGKNILSTKQPKNYICSRCFEKPGRKYITQIIPTTEIGKDMTADPTLPRNYNVKCPKCMTHGCTALLNDRNDILFDYNFYCNNPQCFYWWKIKYN